MAESPQKAAGEVKRCGRCVNYLDWPLERTDFLSILKTAMHKMTSLA